MKVGDFLVWGSWFAGMVLAKGFWSTTAAVCFPPWAWYLTAEFAIGLIK